MTVLMQRIQFETRSHRPHSRLREKVSPMCGMVAPQPLRHQFLDFLTQQFLSPIPE